MSRDPLPDLTRALAEEFDGTHPTPGAVRRRILVRVSERQRSRRRLWAWLVPPLVVLGASSAWAERTGRLPQAVRQVISAVQAVITQPEDRAPTPRAPGPKARAPSSGTAERASDTPSSSQGPGVAQPEPERPVLREPARPDLARPAERAQPQSTPMRTMAPEVSVERDPKEDRSLLLYRQAHDAHFKLGSHAQAERLYAEYLREVPRGGLRAEAAYNRGVCLIRLGRGEEARKSLTPFAEGAYGDYRKEEAQALLSALGEHSGPAPAADQDP